MESDIDRMIETIGEYQRELHAARQLMADVCGDIEIEEGDLAILDFDWIRKLRAEANKDPAISAEWEDRLDGLFDEKEE